ncbi:MAG: response regulator [Planctomycetota bacterium]|jgi:CheY-like chemotaxis protein
MKVLIADPDWRFAEQATSYLESHAHLVVYQPKPTLAITQVQRWQPDLVIVAAELADSGVIEAIHRIKDRPALLLTGWMDRYDVAWRAWQRGGDELLMKPLFKADELQETIITALENASLGIRRQKPAVASA